MHALREFVAWLATAKKVSWVATMENTTIAERN
jgi:hypothetical protein